MAKKTNINLRNLIIYQVFPRQHSNAQNFTGVIKDLDRIAALGVDVIYLLPIHPIGEIARKGSVGSPYSIVDFYAIDSTLGTLEDLKCLVKEAHKRDLKVMIDIVFNHTSRDSILTKEKPEWFYKNKEGAFANRIGDWSDITDLNYDIPEVWDYFINVLKYWARFVDGFRCDVAPLLPIEFWLKARHIVDEVNPDLIWLTESVEYGFIKYLRDEGYDAQTDSQMYEAFDLCYDYDIHSFMQDYLKDKRKLSRWIEEIKRQEVTYPKNYVKLRSFENHDNQRLRSLVRDDVHFIQMTALMFFLKGTPMLYAGQEHAIAHKPDLFENDLIPWNEKNSIEPLIQRLAQLKKDPLFASGNFNVHHSEDVVVLSYTGHHDFMVGIFNLESKESINAPLIDGAYHNEINQSEIIISNGRIILDSSPVVIKTHKENIKI